MVESTCGIGTISCVHPKSSNPGGQSYWKKAFTVRRARFLYQFVTDSIMEALIKQHFPIEVVQSEQDVPSLDYEEVNTLWVHSRVHHPRPPERD